MLKLTPKAHEYIDYVVRQVFGGSGIKGADLYDEGDNPFAYVIEIPMENDERLVMRKCNELFHALGLLPEGNNLAIGEFGDYCQIVSPEPNNCYIVVFNHPAVFELKESDPECRFILRNWRTWDGCDDEGEEAEMLELVEGIKAGLLKSKSSDGYLVLKAEFYDAIEAGKKRIEYRDFTEYNLKRTIGLKTVRFNRGYAKNAPQMRWEVTKVALMDYDEHECNPFDVPDDFWPTTIAIHLGKRLG